MLPSRFGSSLPVARSSRRHAPPRQSKKYFLVPMTVVSTVAVREVTSDGNLKPPRGCTPHRLLSGITVAAVQRCWRQRLLMGSCGSWNLRVGSCKMCMNFLEKSSPRLWSGSRCSSLGVETITCIVWTYWVAVTDDGAQSLLVHTCEMSENVLPF